MLARITRRATGSVEVSYESSGRTTRFMARQVVAHETLPADAVKAGGQLSIQYTGYERRLIRGEQLAKAVAP